MLKNSASIEILAASADQSTISQGESAVEMWNHLIRRNPVS